jgi:hypothetical protein
VANEAGTDGTVRWAGCALNTRKIEVDLTVQAEEENRDQRFAIAPWSNVDIPLIPVDGLNHGTILQKPSDALVRMVVSALQVSSRADLERWYQLPEVREALALRERTPRFQQFVIRAVDERGDPIRDYHLQLFTRDARGRARELEDFDMDVHEYSGDPSFRCFHVNLDELKPEALPNLWMRIIASSGSQVVAYHGYGSDKISADGMRINRSGKWDAEVNISDTLAKAQIDFFHPFTTTLIQIRMNREPLPLAGRNDVFWFHDR